MCSQEVVKKPHEFVAAGRNAVRMGVAAATAAAAAGTTSPTPAAAAADEQPAAADEQPAAKVERPAGRQIKWRQGDMEFEAYMRMLDNAVRPYISRP